MEPRTLVASALQGAAGETLRRFRGFVVCAVGKAATGMVAGFDPPFGTLTRDPLVATAPHPNPTIQSTDTARRALALAAQVDSTSALVLLLSGGASAMMALPADPLTIEDKVQMNAAMLARGVPIAGMNTVRKHLSAVKGGWLAAAAKACCTLAISDVIGEAEDDLSVVGSGPGVADATTFGDAMRIAEAFDLWDAAPPRVRDRLRRGARGEVEDTPKPGDSRLSNTSGFVIGSRRDAMHGARAAAERRGYRVVTIEEPVLGAARAAGPAVIARAMAASVPGVPTCVISSGETTVHVRGDGRGGRNQELALAALPALAAARRSIALVSIGTDGVDGPTDAAGAIADERSLSRALASGARSVDEALDANDSYHFFDRLGDLVRTGPTGTNVGDLQIVCLA